MPGLYCIVGDAPMSNSAIKWFNSSQPTGSQSLSFQLFSPELHGITQKSETPAEAICRLCDVTVTNGACHIPPDYDYLHFFLCMCLLISNAVIQ